MYAVIAEDPSDFETLKALIKRISGNPSTSIKGKGYSGCAEMLRKGASLFDSLNACTRYIICYDSDRDTVENRLQAIKEVFSRTKAKGEFCALIPKQEIESWILADLQSISKVIPSWRPTKEFHHPEEVDDPKEFVERLSREQQRPRYVHSIHNQRVAIHLDLAVVEKKCPSFKPLISIVKDGVGNVRV
jgi:Domain of unknown function (DUF4276)